jgi:tetratricopeptide (TPR) repeat protein
MRARALGLALAGLMSSSLARADEKSAAADALFEEGVRLFAAGSRTEACEKFRESFKLDPQNGTLLAKCHEDIGKTASAWSEYKEVAARAQRANQREREQLATEAVARLETKLRRLSIRVPKTAPETLEIRRNGERVGSAQWGIPIPVDPGELQILASAKGHKDWKRTMTLDAGPGTTEVDIGPLELAPADANARSPRAPDAPPKAKADEGNGKLIGFIVGGAGIAAIGTGAVFQLVALSQDRKRRENEQLAAEANQAGNTAGADAYTAAAKNNRDEAKQGELVAIVTASAGGALLVTGAVVYLVAGKSKADTSTVRLAPVIGPGIAGVAGALQF